MLLSRSRIITQRNLIGAYQKIYVQSAKMSITAAATQKQNLPQLPVPKLIQTVQKYLKSVEPFLNECEFEHTRKLLYQFEAEEGLGSKLQKLLVHKAKETDNWLADWWLNVAYLGYRDPVVVYSSPGLVFPLEKFGCNAEQCQYAAKLILGALSYKEHIDSHKLPVDKMGKDPLDMSQYEKIFGTCRIPGIKQDSLEYNPQSKHIVVARNNHFYKLQVLDNCGKMVGMEQLFEALTDIVKDVKSAGPPIGILTSDNRDNWAKAYQKLVLDFNNLKSIREIQTSLFLVCLDKCMGLDNSIRNLASKQLIHGGGSLKNSANRWYDKTVQFIISEDGIVGLTYEHSPSEGQPIAVMTDYIIDFIRCKSPESESCMSVTPEKLNFNVDECIEKALNNASTNVDKLADNLEMNAFQFTCFGKEFIKSQKLSPDSFIQIAMQFAFYRLHKVPGAHYESAATRKYFRGRTETIRSCSTESIKFAKTMLECEDDREKVHALQAAVEAHKKYSIEAVNGFGVDRHFLGLKLIAAENKFPKPPIFDDPSWIRSTHMRLSTSQVATQCDGFMCYAPLVPDGYGCCYNPRANDINFAVSAFASHPDTSANKFRETLEQSLSDMYGILAKTQKAKL